LSDENVSIEKIPVSYADIIQRSGCFYSRTEYEKYFKNAFY